MAGEAIRVLVGSDRVIGGLEQPFTTFLFYFRPLLTDSLRPLVDSLLLLYEHKIAKLPQVYGSFETLFLFQGRMTCLFGPTYIWETR